MKLSSAPIDLKNEASLQRGAKYFMNFCGGCHSAEYMRYSRMAQDIKLINTDGEILTDMVKTNLMFNTTDINSQIKTGMIKQDAQAWFGVAPPDLTMVARVRGQDWLYTYLKSFYIDAKRPWGVNNLVFKDVAMPNVLQEYQGQQELIDHKLTITKPGLLNSQQFDELVSDLTNFLVYTAEPYRSDRVYLGVWVLLFLSVFFVFAFLMKREYWKDIKKTKK
jgi:ubiquinol-cytochrome c reductase cytochrome c1 subunit